MDKQNKAIWIVFWLVANLLSHAFAQDNQYVFENLGKPVRTPLPIEFVTNDKVTGPIAWAGLTDAERNTLVGVHMKTGELTEVDLTTFGKSNAVLIFKGSEQHIYIYAGKKGRFFKYDIRSGQLTTLGEESGSLYWMKKSFTVAPDGVIYVGTFPRAAVSILDPDSDQVSLLDQVSTTKGSEYVINPASSEEGIVYLPIGMHHGELWAYDPKTKKKTQILPKEMMTYGPPTVWRAKDGKVYGQKGKTIFLCTPTKIVIGLTEPPAEVTKDNSAGALTAQYIDGNGNLILKNQETNQLSKIASNFNAGAHEVFSVGDVHNGKLYGSSMKPGNVFTYDLKSGELEDRGKITRGGVQVYDILSYQDNLFMSSYTGGYIDRFDVTENNDLNGREDVAHLHSMAKQERLVQLVLGPDNMIYSPTTPIKGYLGGVLVRVNPESLKTDVFADLIPNQSLTSVTAISETGELFITTSVAGGTSAKPTEKEAFTFLWDPKKEVITHKEQPVRLAKQYTKPVRASNGLIYGFSRNDYYVFDPVKRKVVFKGKAENYGLPKNSNILLSGQPGPDGLLFGIDRTNGKLLSIDPSDHKITILSQDPSLKNARFAEVKSDGYLYYPHDATLMRVRIN